MKLLKTTPSLTPGQTYRHIGRNGDQWAVAQTEDRFLTDANGWTAFFPTAEAAVEAWKRQSTDG